MFELIIVIFTAVLMYFAGHETGLEEGRKQMHKQEYSCQTLPDKSVHCWENRENK